MIEPHAAENNESPKQRLLSGLIARFGILRKIGGSQSLFEIADGTRVYVRYSRLHGSGRTFFGLRREDLRELEGRQSLVCFLWAEQPEPLFVPFADYEHVFANVSPAQDGQYKAQVFIRDEGTELYIARAGRFNVDGHFGWSEVEAVVKKSGVPVPLLNHCQVQTLIGSIGANKGFDVWVPQNNRASLDWNFANRFDCCEALPPALRPIHAITQEIDVIWLKRGSSEVSAMFEVEHSTSIYSGLLRFNDVHLTAPRLVDRFLVVAKDERRDRFVRQLSRPTFQASGLAERCSFMQYEDVFRWHSRLAP